MPSIYWSPSNQENNLYQGGQTEEFVMNAIVDLVIPMLAPTGLTQYRNDRTWNLEQIIADSISKRPTFHFAVHSNAAQQPNTAKGCVVLIAERGWEAERFANCVYDEITAITPWVDRGVQLMPQLAEVRVPFTQSALIEIDFHDTDESALWIITHLVEIAKALGKGVCKFFNLAIPTTITGEPVHGITNGQEAMDWLVAKGRIDRDFWTVARKYWKPDIVDAILIKWAKDVE